MGNNLYATQYYTASAFGIGRLVCEMELKFVVCMT